jgi:proline iminopeptidase
MRLRYGVGVPLLLVAAVGAGLAAAVVVGSATARPWVFLGAGGLVAGAVGALGGRLLARGRPGRIRGRATVVLAGTAVAVFGVAVLKPLDGGPTYDVPEGLAHWSLATGSRLPYVRIPAEPPARPTPVVVLHGGPGISAMGSDIAYYRPLTRLGYDVYVYDQLGAGRSMRLDDPTGYGIGRDVADLEQVRRTIGADRMVLVGHSYGGALAAHYTAAHPDHIAKLVLMSPGPLDPDDRSGARVQTRLGAGDRVRAYLATLAPRALLGYALLQVNPAAAHAYLGDAEADRRNDKVLAITEPALHCTPDQARRPSAPSGFYALQYPQSATAPPAPDVRRALTGLRTPTLILRGECDYLSRSSATDYVQALPNAELVHVEGAGHNVQADRPVLVRSSLVAFLEGRP